MTSYIIVAIAWLLVSLLLGAYVIGFGLKGKSHYQVGFLTLGISYILGICMLLTCIFMM